MSTVISGEVTMISPLTAIALKNSERSARWARMYRHPSSRSPGRSRAPGEPDVVRTGCGSRMRAAQIPVAESR